jgi:hypothetical protein
VRTKFLGSLLKKISVADLILPAYFAGFIRQYFWTIESNNLAWILTWTFVSGLWAIFVAFRPELPGDDDGQPSGWRFWVIVALPLCVFFLLRAPFPNTNFDVLNYHLVNADRAATGWPLRPGDFFPGTLLVNPAPDIADYIFIRLLGYRLGTVINLLAVSWTARLVERFLRQYIWSAWIRCALALIAVSTEHILFLLNLYMIDLLAIPLLLEAALVALNFDRLRKKGPALVTIAVYIGISLAFKLTNLAFALPIVLLLAFQGYGSLKEVKLHHLLLALFGFATPLILFAGYMYSQTGNPIFPYYNAIFRSPFVVPINYKDPFHGPHSFLQAVIWPVYGVFYPEYISPMAIFILYTGRTFLGLVASIYGLFSKAVPPRSKPLFAITLGGLMLWSFSSGDIRYGMAVEVMSAIAVTLVLVRIFSRFREEGESRPALRPTLIQKVAAVVFVGCAVTAWWQVIALDDNLFGPVFQPTLFQQPTAWVRELPNILTDRDPAKYFSDNEKALFNNIDVWINTWDATSGVELIANKSAPMVSVGRFLTTADITLFDYLQTEASRKKLADTLAEYRGKRMFTLVPRKFTSQCNGYLTRAGLKVDRIVPVNVPFYSKDIRIEMSLIELSNTAR